MHVQSRFELEIRKVGNVDIHQPQRRVVCEYMASTLLAPLPVTLLCEMELAYTVGASQDLQGVRWPK